MERTYAVYCNNRAVGKVQVGRKGLYYRISCRCRVEKDIMYRLYACCGEKGEDLGIVVPVDEGFGLETSIPVKKLGEGELSFRLAAKQEAMDGTLVPVYPEEPFAYIARLKKAYLVKQNGKLFLSVK